MPAAPSGQAVAERTLALVDIPSVSGDEAQVYQYVKDHVDLPLVLDDGESLVYASRTGKPIVLLSGHLDTVPIDGNVPGRIEDGAVHGRGASDMKGGVAVMMELAAWAGDAELAYDLGLLFFPREELGPDANPLPAVFEATPVVDEAALVICLEPTDNTLQLGCLGNIMARVVFEGRSAHSARPWLGVNAIALALEGLRPVLELQPLDVEIDGLVFREVVSVTQIDDCGNAGNVIPGRVEASLNYRYAPNRSPAEAEAWLRELVGPDVEIVQNSPAAPVAIRSPIVEQLREIGGFEVQPKQAWTNVADFAARGLDAINFGPGGTRFAHTPDEQVSIAELGRNFEALKQLLGA